VKFGGDIFELCEQTDGQTDGQTDILITIVRTPPGGGVISGLHVSLQVVHAGLGQRSRILSDNSQGEYKPVR